MKRKRYKQVRQHVLRYCDTLEKYVDDIFCRRSKDAKAIAKLMNELEENPPEKLRPKQIRDGVVHDPNKPHSPPKEEGETSPKSSIDPCPSYCKPKTKEEFMRLAGVDPDNPPEITLKVKK